MTVTRTEFDPAKAEAFAGHHMGILRGSLLARQGPAPIEFAIGRRPNR